MVITWLALPLLLAFQRVSHSSSNGTQFRRSVDTDPDSEVTLSCVDDWFTFGNMCYRLGGKKRIGTVHWDTAAKICEQEFGKLVSIHSLELQDFLTTFMLLSAKENLWIGLHDRDIESVYSWNDESSYDFKHWEPLEPSGSANEKEDCGEMVFRPMKANRKIGYWSDVDCSSWRRYICQKEKEKTTSVYHDPRFCRSEQGGGWSYESSCFHLVTEPKSWSDAEVYCAKEHNGHLATITDFTVNMYLTYVFRNRTQSSWIGIKINAGQEQQKWTSGWYVSYENWKEKPIECVAFTVGGNWSSAPCSRKLPFICEYSTVTPPVLKPGPKGSHCPKNPKGWRDLGGDKCYFFETENSVTWPEANFLCMRRGGTLTSFHANEEITMLHNFVKHTADQIYIGLYRHMGLGDDFVWADGSSVDFKNWAPNEDNSWNEECVEAYTESFKWNDFKCSTKRGFICSVLKSTENTPNPTEPCSSGFSIGAVMGVIFCILFVAILTGVLAYYYRICDRGLDRKKKTSGATLESPSAANTRTRYRTDLIIREDASLYVNMD